MTDGKSCKQDISSAAELKKSRNRSGIGLQVANYEVRSSGQVMYLHGSIRPSNPVPRCAQLIEIVRLKI